jgi:hypothetical protein
MLAELLGKVPAVLQSHVRTISREGADGIWKIRESAFLSLRGGSGANGTENPASACLGSR